MKPYQANLVNITVLVIMGYWAYFGADAESRSITALIPVAFAVLLALFTPAFKREEKVAAHVVVLLTLVLITALFMPLRGALLREDTLAIFRVIAMLSVSMIAMVIYVRSFIAARKRKG